MVSKGKFRLDKCVAHAFDLSRSQAKALISDQGVSVNSELVFNPNLEIQNSDYLGLDSDSEVLVFDIFKTRVYMMNKPQNVVCADRDAHHNTVLDLMDELRKSDLHCVGRLDIDTTGLLLITDDGDFNHHITSPKRNITKIYEAVVDKPLQEKFITIFARGIKHPDEKMRYKSARLTIIEEYKAQVAVTEGKFHEVKRMFEYVGLQVLELKRLQIGPLVLDADLEEGCYRQLDDSEIQALIQHKDSL